MNGREAELRTAAGSAISQPAIVTNVVATLKGTQPESTSSGVTWSAAITIDVAQPTDAKCDAPAQMMTHREPPPCLRWRALMAKYRFDAT